MLTRKYMRYFFFIMTGLLILKSATADPITDVSVVSMITTAMGPATDKLLTQSMGWLGSFIGLQFFATQFALLKSGADIEAILGKLIGSLAWFGICIYLLLNGPQFILAVGNQFFGMLGMSLPSPGGIIASTVGIAATLAAIAAGVNYVNSSIAQLILYILIFVFIVGMGFAVKIFMLQLELGLVVMLSPMSFSFLGLNALKDQGIAPLKALISLGYRILLITIILSAYTQVGSAFVDTLKGFKTEAIIAGGIGLFMETILAALGAYAMLGYLLYKSDAIASSLASGGTSMGGGDVAGAAAAGAAAGATVAAAGAAVATAPQSMASAIGNMMSGGSIGNATPGSGSGPAVVGSPGVRPPSASAGPTTSSGAPKRPDSVAGSPSSPNFVGPQAPSAKGTPSTAGADAGTGAGSPSSSGSGQNAGIVGGGSKLEENLGKLVDQLGNQQSGGKTFGDHMGNLNHHVAQEGAATHVSISTNHSD